MGLMGQGEALASSAAPCFGCGESGATELFTARDFDTARTTFAVVRCSGCALAYTAGVDDAVLEAVYSRDYYGSEEVKFVSAIEWLVRRGQRRQARKILKLYQQGVSRKQDAPLQVLDIGCGRGLLLRAFAELGARCLGIERGEFPGTKTDGVEMHVGALTDSELAGSQFDIIVSWHSLEHVTDLGALLEVLPAHLKPGGLLVLSVPNFSSWQSRFFGRHWFHLDLPRHVIHFDKHWLERWVAREGFSIVSSNTLTPTQNIYGFLQSAMNVLAPSRPNRLYHLLTHGRGWLERSGILGWAILGVLLMPFALLETLLSELLGRGATLTLYARKR